MKPLIKKLILIQGVLFIFIGCGGKKSEQLIINELGLTMSIPQDWKLDEDNKRLFYDPTKTHDSYGSVEDALLQRQSLSQYVDSIYQHGFPVNIKSKTTKKFGDYDAIEVITEAVYTTHDIYIQRGNKVIHISLRCLKQDYPKWETQFNKSLNSVKVM